MALLTAVAVASLGVLVLLGLAGSPAAAAEPNPVHMVDSSLPVVSAISQVVGETDRNQTVRVAIVLDRPAEQTVRVRYTTVAGSAAEQKDYNRRTGVVTIPRNQTSRSATVIVRGDDDDEPREEFRVVLSSPVNAELGSDATITIEDDDEPFEPPVVSAIATTVLESDRNQIVRVTIALDRPAPRTARVRYTTVSGTATENRDYTRRSGTVVFPRNRQSATVPITIRGDVLPEEVEHFRLVLSDPTDAVLGSNAVISIEDDDEPLPVASVVPLVVEETERTNTVRVTIELDKPAPAPVRVRYTTVQETATQNQDYSRRVGTARFSRNQRTVTVPVAIRGDAVQEPTETLRIELSAPVGLELGDNSTITIVDNDDPPYPWLGWFEVEPRYHPPSPDIHVLDRDSITGDPYGAVRQALDEHGEVRLIGTFEFDRALSLQSGQVLRGAGPDRTTLRFNGQGSGIRADLGGISGVERAVSSAAVGDRALQLGQPDTAGLFRTGQLVVLSTFDQNHPPLTLRIADRPDPSTLLLDGPLPRDVVDGERLMALNREPIVGVGIDAMTIEAVGDVDWLIYFRGVVGGWVNDVHSINPRRAHIAVNFSRGCHVGSSFFDDSSNHGDGGRGYGVSLANGSVGCLVEDNEFRHLRHSMILNEGAGGNAVVFNHSWEAHHPNFPTGGPPDILVHGPAFANLFEGNVVERILIGDRETGAGNVFVRNCLTSAPLGYQHGRGTQVMIGNAMYGSDSTLRTLRMEDRWPDHEPFPGGATTLPFLSPGTSIFDGRGVVRIAAVTGADALPDPVEFDNWFDGRPDGPRSTGRQPLTVFSGRHPILQDPQATDWTVDCGIPAATDPGRGADRP